MAILKCVKLEIVSGIHENIFVGLEKPWCDFLGFRTGSATKKGSRPPELRRCVLLRRRQCPRRPLDGPARVSEGENSYARPVGARPDQSGGGQPGARMFKCRGVSIRSVLEAGTDHFHGRVRSPTTLPRFSASRPCWTWCRGKPPDRCDEPVVTRSPDTAVCFCRVLSPWRRGPWRFVTNTTSPASESLLLWTRT